MGVNTTITCDQCEHDLTYTGNREDWRLVLTYEALAHRGGAVTDMAISTPVDRKYVFCGIGCLAAWLAKERPAALSDYERLMKQREWLTVGKRRLGDSSI